MFQQTSVASYFGKRKRKAGDDSGIITKKIAVDETNPAKRVYLDEKCSKHLNGNVLPVNKKKLEIGRSDIRHSFKKLSDGKKIAGELRRNQNDEEASKHPSQSQQPLIEESLETDKKTESISNENFQKSKNTDDIIKSANELVQKMREKKKMLGEKKEQPLDTAAARKELSLGEIKMKLLKSSRLDELKSKMNKFNDMVKKYEQPELKKFDSIEFNIPKSPVKAKNKLYSPVKSPVKAAYQRYSLLVDQTTSLILPFNYQKLYELFQAVDTVCSMLVNRGETITFTKLKPAVQAMTRRNFSEHHLGQIKTVFPNGFKFRLEKVRNFGSTSKIEKYELVVDPAFEKGETWNRNVQLTPKKCEDDDGDDIIRNADKCIMSPKVLLERREMFYRELLEKTKDYHEEFLQSLEPPVSISRHDLKRWHPNFMLDHVPSIVSSELPVPPESDKGCSAKDVLERARNFLNNPRLQKALETTSQAFENEEGSKRRDDASEKVTEKISNPLKGIPKALLEKVKARQAAKAVETMYQSRNDELQSVMYTRLPEIARILRTSFIDEQKSVLSRDAAVDKIKFSSKSHLSSRDVETHLDLLLKTVPEWLSQQQVRKLSYIKINKSINIPDVMKKLETLSAEKNNLSA